MAEQPIDPSAMIDRVSSKQMGVKPEMPQEQTQPPVPQQAAEKAPEVPTDQEKAIAEGSPETEGDRMSAEAILYEIDFGDGEIRKLSPHQISETFKRYRDVNHKQAQNANLNRVVEAAIKNGIAKSPDDAARMILNAIKASQSNPQMGDDDGKTNAQAKSEAESRMDALAQWEEDNAVTLPPGFREQAEMMNRMGANMTQLQKMLGQVLQQSQGTAAKAAQQGVEAQNMKGQAIKQAIANNLDRAAQATGLTEDQAEDFRIFAYERGYTEDDFVDGQLTAKVMNDYKNSVQSPEMDRLRDINKRRQAFTGSVVQTPTSGDAGGEANPPATTLDRLTSKAMNRTG